MTKKERKSTKYKKCQLVWDRLRKENEVKQVETKVSSFRAFATQNHDI